MSWYVLFALLGLALGQSNDDVAFIIGGFDEFADGPSQILSSVEIFGCSSGEPLVVDDFPTNVYYAAGKYLHDEKSVLVCGGWSCTTDGDICDIDDKCFKWNPYNGWQPAVPMAFPKWNHILALGNNLDQPEDETLVPIAIGDPSNEIFDNDRHTWVEYREIQDILFVSRCLVQAGSHIFFSSTDNRLYALDLDTWETDALGILPLDNDENNGLGRCTVAKVNGAEGKSAKLNINCYY